MNFNLIDKYWNAIYTNELSILKDILSNDIEVDTNGKKYKGFGDVFRIISCISNMVNYDIYTKRIKYKVNDKYIVDFEQLLKLKDGRE